jgi:hypothetical protein
MMNTNNFKILVEALEALPEGIRNNKVNMSSVDEPTCGTAGCFSGLISIVANDIPELKDSYGYKTFYFFQGWAKALNEYLDINFRKWAEENPETWGNAYGWHMFNSSKAFGKNHGDALTHDKIIIHLIGVCNRLEQSNTVKPA